MFTWPWFLAGLVGLGLPVWLHLLQQHRMDPLKFASLMFFERRTETSVKQRKLKYKVLLALRLLLILLMVLLFARPFWERDAASAAGESKLVIYAVDRSYSMRAAGRFERARQEAASLAGGQRPNDLGQAIAVSSNVELLTQAVGDKQQILAAIQALQPGDGRGLYGEIARSVRTMAQAAGRPVEVHLFTDAQKSGLPAAFSELGLPVGVTLKVHAVASDSPRNWTVESVNAPRTIADPKKGRIQATIAGFNTDAAQRQVSLVVNGKAVGSKTASVPANGRASVEFIGFDANYGWNRAEVRVDSADGFKDDDAFVFSMERADPRPVLFVRDPRQARSGLYFRAALESAANALYTLEEMTPDQVSGVQPSKYAFVVLSDVGSVPGPFEEALRSYVRGGGGALVAAGPAAAARQRVPLTDLRVLESRYASRGAERFLAASWFDPAHPSVRKANRWEGVKFYQAVRVEPGDSRVVARLNDESPLLIERTVGEGRVLVFTSALDNLSNDFPIRASFVPFVEQTAHHLSRTEERGAAAPVDSYLELRKDKGRASALEVLDPDGKRALSLEEATKAENVKLARAGFYDVRRENGRRELVAVNADRRESDLTQMGKDTLALWQNSGGETRAAAGGKLEKRVYSPWWWLALGLFLTMMAETLLASRHLGRQES
ncbi:MAG: VWA domain-containing protein [Acidobacteria bacterium]|nr:VWA domain-containing protein [Acidobacteriota bacterium]